MIKDVASPLYGRRNFESSGVNPDAATRKGTPSPLGGEVQWVVSVNLYFDLKGLTPKGIERFCTEELKQKPGQGLRVAVWLYRRRVEDFDAMTDLNRPFREELKKGCALSSLAIERRPLPGTARKTPLSTR